MEPNPAVILRDPSTALRFAQDDGRDGFTVRDYARHDNKKTAATIMIDAALHKNEWRWERLYPV